LIELFLLGHYVHIAGNDR